MSQPNGQQKPPSILRRDSESRDAVQNCVSPSSFLGLHTHTSPKQAPKSVSIVQEPEVISPLILAGQKAVDSDCNLEQRPSPKRLSIRRPSSKRLSGRLSATPSPSLSASKPGSAASGATDEGEDDTSHKQHSSHHHHLEHLIDQVSQWIKTERTKRVEKKLPHDSGSASRDGSPGGARRYSNGSELSFDLDKLEDIIKYNLSLERQSRRSRNRSPSYQRRKSSLTQQQRKQSSASSDTETATYDSDDGVPSCSAVLDNSKTLAYPDAVHSDSDASSDELERTASYKDQGAWAKFKFEIVRLTHTLRIKGWRRVAMSMSSKIAVERLSGALTNAVYVVTPPKDAPALAGRESSNEQAQPKKPPPKLLLRIYGPQVDHLIDREAELAILRRLGKKNIGPRMLGTFTNGRFEEYFYAKTLTPDDLRIPDTSRQIAKRMRELHDGIDLLEQERNDGAFVWRNWDKWVNRVEHVVSWLDCQIARLEPGARPVGSEAWKRRGFICGARWEEFRKMVEKYRAWLEAQYGGRQGVREQLVFAHNDTQYGNILRLLPSGDSPLLLPANSHKQLVVIDFEYSNANLPGLEFANHFTEWCYNYHDVRRPYAFHANQYPTPEEQDRFVRAYVRHRPQVNVNTPKLGPSIPPASQSSNDGLVRRPTSSITDFMLDARTPSTGNINHQNEEIERKEKEDKDVARLIHETRIWRLANTAQWVAWGIVQAKVPGMPNFDKEEAAAPAPNSDEEAGEKDLGERADVYKDLTAQQEGNDVNGAEQEEAEEEFDYLGYAQHRAMFFWADAIRFGFAKEEDLPEETRGKIKTVPY